MAKPNLESVDDYIDSQPEAVRETLGLVRAAIREAIPLAQEAISYDMPTYSMNGKRVIYFAVWKQYYSIYGATERVAAAFRDALAAYKVEKGTIRFPLSKPVPVQLIGRIAKFRAAEVSGTGPLADARGS